MKNHVKAVYFLKMGRKKLKLLELKKLLLNEIVMLIALRSVAVWGFCNYIVLLITRTRAITRTPTTIVEKDDASKSARGQNGQL